MASRAVVSRQKSTNIVVSAHETHGEQVAQKASETLSGFLKDGEQMPDLALLGTLAARMMVAASETLVAADQAHEVELSDDAPARDARDDAESELGGLLVSVRMVVLGSFGAEALERVELAGETPDDSVERVRRARAAARAFRAGSLPQPLFEAVNFNANAWAARLESLAQRVEDALASVQTERREAESTMLSRDEAKNAYDARFRQGAGFLVGLFGLAGEHDLASRIRPSEARPGRVDRTPDEPIT